MRRINLGKLSVDVPHTRVDRLIESIAPRWGARRLQARVGLALCEMSAGGYHGGDSTRRSIAGWGARLRDADGATLPQLQQLRAASSDLIRNAPIAAGAVSTNVLNVVGTGLAMNSRINAAVLGMGEDAAKAWQDATEREWRLWCESTDCDAAGRLNFYRLQALAFRSTLEMGDMLVVTPALERPGRPYRLAVQLVEAPRVCNPSGRPDTDALVAGVELGAYGEHAAYHVAARHPGAYRLAAARNTWRRIAARGDNGRRNAWLVGDPKRIGQTRTPPWLAEVIEPLKQLERYTEAELMAAVVSGMFTVFIKAEGEPDVSPVADAQTGVGGGAPQEAGWNGQLGYGLGVALGENESIETANPGRPNAQFDPFVVAIVRQIGAVLQIPFEVLLKVYQSSYSASKAAMLDAWRFFRDRRAWLVGEFCQPIYELWLDEAVASGRIAASGYFADPLLRMAWRGTEWVGDGMGTIDPLKDVQAARDRIAIGISTTAAESLLHDGMSWEDKHKQRVREVAARREAGLETPPQPGASTLAEEVPADG